MFKRILAAFTVLVLLLVSAGCKLNIKSNKTSSSVESSKKTEVSSNSGSEATRTDKESSVISDTQSKVEGQADTSSTTTSSVKKPSTTSSSQASSSSVPASNPSAAPSPIVKDYTGDLDIDDNVFMDSLIYTGYNITKHRSDGLMWTYILASQKRAKGWLSNIGYGGGCTGYETDSSGKPNIARFEKGGLVCASFVTYVYFNYLPNVAGLDTSYLTKPADPTKAHSWYLAAKQWVASGYSKQISFTALSYKSGSGYAITFKPSEQIPIGSIMLFRDYNNNADRGSHVCVYAGYKNGHNWVYHVGNSNGPEFCSVERMGYGPDPQYPLAVISTPTNLRVAACVELSLKDDKGAAIQGVSFTAKNTKTGTTYNLGTTSAEGKLSYYGMPYGNYVITHTVSQGYSSEQGSITVNLTTANNSLSSINIVDKKLASAESSDKSKEENKSKD